MLCCSCLEKFKANPASLKRAPVPPAKQPENKPRPGLGKRAGLPIPEIREKWQAYMDANAAKAKRA